MIQLKRHGKQLVSRLQRDHKAGQKRIMMAFQKLRKHPDCYKPGFKPSGSGMKIPKGVTKQAAGIFGLLTKKSDILKKLFAGAKQKVIAHVKKHGIDIAKDIGKASAGVIAKRLLQRKRQLESHVNSYKKRAATHVDSAESRVHKFIKQYAQGAGLKRAAVKLFKK